MFGSSVLSGQTRALACFNIWDISNFYLKWFDHPQFTVFFEYATRVVLVWSKTCWHHPAWARTGSRPGRGAGSYDLSEAFPSQPRDLNCRRGPVHFASFNPQRGCTGLKTTSHDTEASTLSLPGPWEVSKTLVRLYILFHVSVYYCGWSSTNSLNPCKTVRPKYSITAQ